MRNYFLTVTPHDPIIARDGRPFGFGQGQRMRSLDWLYPSVFAGSLRTMIGNIDHHGFPMNKSDSIYQNKIDFLLKISLTGPFMKFGNDLYFPAPADLLVSGSKSNDKTERYLMPLRPVSREMSDEWGCDLPDNLAPIIVTDDIKPEKIPAFWSYQEMIKWLIDASGKTFDLPPEISQVKSGCGFMNVPEKDERFHVSIETNLGAAAEGMLFKTVGLDLNVKSSQNKIHLAAQADIPEEYSDKIASLNQLHPLGGERRLANWKLISSEKSTDSSWSVPPEIVNTLKGKNLIRLILATPAIFGEGWRPKWLNEISDDGRLVGSPPESKIRLKLISACVNRWKPISGWSMEHNGPKAIYRLVPAGSVYFFEVLDGHSAGDIAEELWLKSMCDDVDGSEYRNPDQHRRDGFGLALWGLWEYGNIQNGDK